MITINVGPVLSYRGFKRHPNGITWNVTALIGVPDTSPTPNLWVEGRPAASPMVLANRDGITILRYDLSVELESQERRVRYSIENQGPGWEFSAPAVMLDVRSAYVSCNGFSDPTVMRKLIHKAGAVWNDLVINHDRTLYPEAVLDKEQAWHVERGFGTVVQRFHVLMMGGDQMYFDSIWDDLPELKEWADMDRSMQLAFAVSEELRLKISKYYFNKYCERWLKPSRGSWSADPQERDSADAMARMPTVMMWDDHDIFDGWGSYSSEMQNCPLAQALFNSAREAFWVYQLQHPLATLVPLKRQIPEIFDSPKFQPIAWTKILAADPLALRLLDNQPGFSSTMELGKVALLVLDLRTERSRTQVLSEHTMMAVDECLSQLSSATTGGEIHHAVLMSSVPVAHPKLAAAEMLLDSFGCEHVVESSADDLKDHWSHDDHESERKRLVRMLLRTAQEKRIRISIVSGDVHVAAWGNLFRNDANASTNWLRIQQFTSSAVLHPAPSGPIEGLFLKMLDTAAARPQLIDTEHRCEMMHFPGHNKYMMAARNWLALEPDANHGDAGPRLWASWRCEGATSYTNHLLAVHPTPAQ